MEQGVCKGFQQESSVNLNKPKANTFELGEIMSKSMANQGKTIRT